MQNPAESSVRSVYGADEALSSIKMITLAPELGDSPELISHLTQRGIVVSLGQYVHSSSERFHTNASRSPQTCFGSFLLPMNTPYEYSL